MTADPRARWAELLSTRADAGPDAALSAFLRALPGDDFLPPPERAAAVNALGGASVPVGKDHDAEQLLRDEVAAFAKNYWALPPTERLTAWSDLSRRATDERTAGRLLALEPGLEVWADPLADPGAEELAALVRELFVLPPRARSIRRNEWLAARASDGDLWPQVRAAFAELCRVAPDRAALDPQLGVALGAPFDRAALHAGHTAETNTHSRATDVAKRAALVGKMRDYKQRVALRKAEAEPSGSLVTRVNLWVVLVVPFVVFIGCLATQHRGYGGRPRPPEPPSYKPSPSFSPTPDVPLPPMPLGPPPVFRQSFTFTRAQIIEYQDYHRNPIGSKPVLFDIWVVVGKPTEPGTYRLPATAP